jgi:hypothetical protein
MNLERDDEPIRGARLAPVRTVRRRLVSPSGREVVVDVPVYPPFRLPSEDERKASQAAGVSGSANGRAPGVVHADGPEDDRAGDPDGDQTGPSAA